MRPLAVLLTLAVCILPAYGAKRVSVAELEQSIAAAHGLPDVEVARRLSNLELTERLSAANFHRLETSLPGEKAQQALVILADASVFRDPPAAEIPAQPTPDVAAQRTILALTVNYVTQTLHQLPNFFATRVTRSFQDTPATRTHSTVTNSGLGVSSPTGYKPIHLVGDSSVTVAFRGGHEVVEKSSLDSPVRNLTTSGVFGPILSTVLVDAARSKLQWSHWENGATGLQAIFKYDVPKENSHYTLSYDSVPVEPQSCSVTPQTFNKVVAYHGEMAINPATGVILRLTLSTDMNPYGFTVKSGIEVEYGQVSIGGKDYFLPVSSVTSSLAHYLLVLGGGAECSYIAVSEGLQNSMNHVVFRNYHVFRAESSIVSDSEAAALTGQPTPTPNGDGAQQAQVENTSTPSSATPATSLPQSSSQAPSSTTTAANASNPPAPDSQPAPLPDQSIAESAPPPPANSQIPGTPVFSTTSRQVLVDVVVDKKNGTPVSGLPKSNFSIEDDGKPQTIDYFEEHSASASAALAQPQMPPLPPGAITNVPTAPPSDALYVFLLDSLNSEPQDQQYVRQQILSYLHKLDPGTQVAVFSLGSSLRLLQGFTSDSAALLAAVGRTEPVRNAMAQTRSDSADEADSIAALQAMRSSGVGAIQAAQVNAHAYSFGARASMSFDALNSLARYLQSIPGRKNLIWFSSSFPVLFFPTPAEIKQLRNNPEIPGYLNHVKQTANLFTLSRIAVYPVSGAGVMTSNIGLADSPDAGSAGGTGHFGSAARPTASLTAEALNSASAVTGMEQLASSTGGRAITTNDIDSALRKIVHDSDVYYTLGFAPSDSPADGAFRRISVKVSGGKFKLAYRQGYNAVSNSTPGAPSEDPIAPLLRFGIPSATGVLYGATVAQKTESNPSNSDAAPAGQNPQLKGPLTRYTISLTIRAQDISFLQAANGERVAKLLIGVKAYANDGSALNWQASREAAQVSPAQYAKIVDTGLPVSIDLDLPANTPARIVTAVYDWNTDRSGTLELPLHP